MCQSTSFDVLVAFSFFAKTEVCVVAVVVCCCCWEKEKKWNWPCSVKRSVNDDKERNEPNRMNFIIYFVCNDLLVFMIVLHVVCAKKVGNYGARRHFGFHNNEMSNVDRRPIINYQLGLALPETQDPTVITLLQCVPFTFPFDVMGIFRDPSLELLIGTLTFDSHAEMYKYTANSNEWGSRFTFDDERWKIKSRSPWKKPLSGTQYPFAYLVGK